jgi:hypothetical protein
MTVEINQLAPDVWQQRVSTSAHPEDAFDYVADFGRHVEWERELLAVQPINRRTTKYLKTYGARPMGLLDRMFSRGLRVTCAVMAAERPERIIWRQYRSRDASEPSSFQKLQFVITPSGYGSLIVLTRWFSGIEGIGADLVSRFSSRWGQVFQGLPPEIRAAAQGSPSERPGLFSTPDELVRQLLEGHPSRGPGPVSLERLRAILDGDDRSAFRD